MVGYLSPVFFLIFACSCNTVCSFSIRSFARKSSLPTTSKRNLPNAILSQNSLPKPRIHAFPLKFKVMESEEETAVDEEEIEFDSTDSNGILKKLSRGIVPIAASVGFAVTPSSGLALRLAGAAMGGVAGFVAKKGLIDRMIREEREEFDEAEDEHEKSGGDWGPGFLSTDVAAALDLLSNGPPLQTLTVKSLESAAKKCGVRAENLSELFTVVFAELIFTVVESSSLDLTELGEILDFAVTMGLTDAEIGDGFTLAASRFGRLAPKDSQGFFVSRNPEQLIFNAAKVFFLADKMIGSSEGYFGKRTAVALSFFEPESLKVIITDACTELFKRCIEGVVSSPDLFTAEEVQRLKEFLSASSSVTDLRPANMQNIIMQTLQFSVDKSLGDEAINEAMDVKLENFPVLQSAQDILGWDNREFSSTIEAKTMPVFQVAAKRILENTLSEPEKAAQYSETLKERLESLNIDVRKARVYMTTLVSEKNNEYMTMIDRVYNISGGNVEPAFKIMKKYANDHAALVTLIEPIMDGLEIPIPGLPFAEMVRVAMYEMKLMKKDGQGASALKDDMFSLNEAQQAIVKKNLALPKVTTWVAQCIAEGSKSTNDDAKAAYQKMLKANNVADSDWQSTAIDFYYQEVKKISDTRAVPSAVDMIRLNEIKNFLGVPDDFASKVNLELLGDKYSKAVTESMMPTGVIAEEYLEGLERLRDRLGITKDDASNLLGFNARNRLGPVVKELIGQWKSDRDGTNRAKQRKDKSGDPISSQDNIFGYMETGAQNESGGPNVFMREALNLVDFFTQNYLGQDIDLETIEKLPVTATGLAKMNDMIDMYKHYLITRLTEQNPALRERYEKDEKLFAMILGIAPESQIKVRESLAYTAYKNMIKSILRYKESGVDERDLQQFGLLKGSLKLDQDVADRVLSESSKGAVLEHTAAFLRNKDSVITVETAIRLRKQIQSLGLSIQRDAGFNEKLVAYLYSLEVQAAVEEGREDDLRDIQEAYEIPEERAALIVEASCRRYISQLTNLALRAAKKYDEKESIMWTEKIARYIVLVEKAVDADGNLFAESDKLRLIEFYEGYNKDNGQWTEEKEDIASRLRTLINLTEDFVAPIEGIDGLLGVKSSMASTDGSSDDKKKWAWG